MSSGHSLLSVQESASSVDGLAASGDVKSGGSAAQCSQAKQLRQRPRLSGPIKRTSLAEGTTEVCVCMMEALRCFFFCCFALA